MISVPRPVRARLALVAGLCLLALTSAGAPASADSPTSGGDVTVAQTLGDRELTVVLRRVTAVPGPLRVDVVTHTGDAAGRLSLQVTPTGTTTRPTSLPAAGLATGRTAVDLGATPGAYSATLTVDRPGPWELAVSDGRHETHIPFVVFVQATSPAERAVYGGFLGAGALMLLSVVVAAWARRTWWTLLPAAGTVASLTVAVTAGVVSMSLPLPPQPGMQVDPTVDTVTDPYALSTPLITDFTRPPVTLTLDAPGVTAGQPLDLGVNLIDAATGTPVDDLVVHDGALMHLLVVGPSGQLWHVHPARTAPGRFQVHLVLPDAGHYAVSAELVRRGGGDQLARAAAGLDVRPAGLRAAGPPGSALHLDAGSTTASTTVDATRIDVTVTGTAANTPITVNATIGSTADLQPWLGMVGHMIVAGPLPQDDASAVGAAVQDAPVLAHAHSMGGMGSMPMTGGSAMGGMIGAPPVNGDSAPDETVAAYGPDVPFTFTFPVPGDYRLWIQVERGYTVVTVPVQLDVAGPTPGMPR